MIREEEIINIGRITKSRGIRGEVEMRFTDDVFDRGDSEYFVLHIDGIPVPFFQIAEEGQEMIPPSYPVIVKPTDRSGSRAITKVETPDKLQEAIKNAVSQSFEKKAIVEEYICGAEYSVETISFEGNHTCLAITKKYTTGEPHYIEVGHLQPAPLKEQMKEKSFLSYLTVYLSFRPAMMPLTRSPVLWTTWSRDWYSTG